MSERSQHTWDILFMRRAFELAQRGIGNVSPNPMVGCVITHQNEIIGEGWHRQYGEAHAEVNAVNSVANQSLLSRCTAYVTLEPCAHFGKTPPCADLLIKHQFKRVVIANQDPFAQVNGGGIQKLKAAGITVELGLLAEQGEALNKRFFTVQRLKRPYVVLKWAQTADGFVARENYDSKWISNEYSRKLVHKWRADESAILVGKNTAKYDNPSLNVRDWEGKHPLRIVVDKNLELAGNLKLFDQTIPTVVYNTIETGQVENLSKVKVGFDDLVNNVLSDLHEKGIQSLFVEGGANTLQQFIDQGLWDEARVFQSKTKFESGIPAPQLNGSVPFQLQQVGGDQLQIFKK